jgi:ribosome biogenesis GTPase A
MNVHTNCTSLFSQHLSIVASPIIVRQVGSTPGVTKGIQEIHLDKHIRLLDSPGIVFTSGEGAAAAALRNAIKVRYNTAAAAQLSRHLLSLCMGLW